MHTVIDYERRRFPHKLSAYVALSGRHQMQNWWEKNKRHYIHPLKIMKRRKSNRNWDSVSVYSFAISSTSEKAGQSLALWHQCPNGTALFLETVIRFYSFLHGEFRRLSWAFSERHNKSERRVFCIRFQHEQKYPPHMMENSIFSSRR